MNDIYSIKNLTIKNFKCYDDTCQLVELGRDLTIVIGQNGAGKTVFLNALKKVLSIILTRDRRRNMEFIGDVLNVKQDTIKNSEVRYNYDFSLTGEEYSFPVTISCNGVIRGNLMSWCLDKPDLGPYSALSYRDALDAFLQPLNDANAYPQLPLLCYFSDCYPHVRNDLSTYEKTILNEKINNPERRAGYYHWDSDSADILFWTSLFIEAYKKINDTVTGLPATQAALLKADLSNRAHLVLTERMESLERSQREIDYITNVLRTFTHCIPNYDNKNIEIDSISVGNHVNNSGKYVDAVKINFSNGKSSYFDMLPEGHKRLFSIVFEIAYRHFILNRSLILSREACEPKGIVVVDEIELHLHPSLAEEVIQRMRRTFPGVQLIVTTHSPIIISSVYNDNDNVRVLKLDKKHHFSVAENCFKAEYGDTLAMTMGSYSSMRYTTILREKYLTALENHDAEMQQQVRNELLLFIGNIFGAENVVNDILDEWSEYL